MLNKERKRGQVPSSNSGELLKRERSVASLSVFADVLSQAGGVALLAVFDGADAHDSGMDGAGDAVRGLDVNLGHLELGLVIRIVFLYVSL